MSAHMKTHHIRAHHHPTLMLYITYNHVTYAIPKKIADKYIVDKQTTDDSITSKEVFKQLESKLTKAGTLLKGLRTREGFTQIEFAKKINVTQANLSNMENGRRSIGKKIAKRIEKIFRIDYRYFLE